MTFNPFTTVPAYDPEAAKADRVYIPIKRVRGLLVVARPTKYQDSGFVTEHAPDGTDVVVVDFAVLDPIGQAQNEMGEVLQGFPAGQQFRDQYVLQRYLIGTFKRYVGHTLIGTTYFGPKTKGQPPIMWQDLSGDPGAVQRGQQFLAAHPEFLIPLEAQIVTAEPDAPAAGYGPPQGGYGPPQGQVVQSAPQSRPANTLEAMRALASTGNQFQGEPPF